VAVVAVAVVVTPVQRLGKVLLALVVKLQLAPTKDKVAPPDLVTVVEVVEVVAVGEAATAALYPAAIKVVLPVRMVEVQGPGKIHPGVLLEGQLLNTTVVVLLWAAPAADQVVWATLFLNLMFQVP
jgi:hypothetical protein